MRRTCRCVEMAGITCYQSTWSHLVDQKALEFSHRSSKWQSISFVKIAFFMKVEMMLRFHKLENLYSCLYLCLFVCNFAVKLAFVPSLLAIVFANKIWYQFHPHSFHRSFNGNCTTFTKGS